jgi:two-component system sensor histidine kinase CssS
MMKRWPLWLQIWASFIGMMMVLVLIFVLLFPTMLSRFFTHEIYKVIESAQNNLLLSPLQSPMDRTLSDSERGIALQDARTVQHVILFDGGRIAEIVNGRLFNPRRNRRVDDLRGAPTAFFELITQQAPLQTDEMQQYKEQFDDETIYYMIRRATISDRDVYLISYLWDTYRRNMVQSLNQQIWLFINLLLLLSVIPSIWLARVLSRPLVDLERSVTLIAERQWHNPITVNRSDEIGRLAASIDRMRERLKAQDESQQSMLQNISHELKTPVMLIQSYAQSIRDGVYPQGNLDASIDVIQGEAERLEKRIRDLLYMTKLQYMAAQPLRAERFAIDEVVHHVVQRLRAKRPELVWEVRLSPEQIVGDVNQWNSAIENVLDNALRYAKSRVRINLHRNDENCLRLAIMNDGPPISAENLERIFDPYTKGPDGEFGLGLAIARRIADLQRVALKCNHVAEGVEFEWIWPKVELK